MIKFKFKFALFPVIATASCIVAPLTPSAQETTGTVEYISAGCFEAEINTHKGMTVFRNGRIYNWETDKNGKDIFKNQVGRNKSAANELFKFMDDSKWDKETFSCPAAANETYCYLKHSSPKTGEKVLNWSSDKVTNGLCTLPEATKKLYNQTVTIGVDAMNGWQGRNTSSLKNPPTL